MYIDDRIDRSEFDIRSLLQRLIEIGKIYDRAAQCDCVNNTKAFRHSDYRRSHVI